MGLLEPDALSLTQGETRAVARARVGARFTAAAAADLRARAGGWMAGTVLLLEAPTRALPPGRTAATGAQQVLFDYFAAEIFDRAPAEAQRLLLSTAILPEVSVAAASALAGEVRAAELLSEIVAWNFFTVRLAGEEPRYRYHPLFREFLLARARRALDDAAWRALSSRAAGLLEEAGSLEDAAAILAAAGEHAGLARLVKEHAAELAREGRLASVERWIGLLPEAMVGDEPWLGYWIGVCRLADLPRARAAFEAAYRRFREAGDRTGSLLAWAGYVSTYFFVWDEFASLDPWIAEMDALRREAPDFPSLDAEVQVTQAMLGCLNYRVPAHPARAEWDARAAALLEADVAPELRMQLATQAVFFRVAWGDHSGARALIERARPLATAPDVRPLTKILWDVEAASYDARVGETERCLKAVEGGLATAAQAGVLQLNHLLQLQAVYGALAAGDLGEARRYLARAGEALGPARLDRAHFHHLRAWIELCAGELDRAENEARESMRFGLASGADLAAAWGEYTLAHVLLERGRLDEAIPLVERAHAWSLRVGNACVDHDCRLFLADVAARQGRIAEAVERLRGAYRLGRERGFIQHTWIGWRKDLLARLAAFALEHGVDPEHAGAIIRANRLSAPADGEARDRWPWPLRVRTLGGFALHLDGAPVAFGPRPPRKPLELLQALVALGGDGVREERLVDALWPDAQGDAGQHAIETTLHRLRKLLGRPGLVVQRGRTISLEPANCWTDVGALRRRLAARDGTGPAVLAEGVLEVYRGPLLPELEAEWAHAARQHLRTQVSRFLRAKGEELARAGDRQAAAGIARRAGAVDPDLAVEPGDEG
jgi:hypothetical protein